jgi:aminoglycoside phosphotransferase (APT) family kinase protein
MTPTPNLVDAMFGRYGIAGPWRPLRSTGLANHVYATDEVVLRVATDHPDGVADARTESVAAPVAHAAGVLTPRLIAFDDSRTIVDRPFSLWERVHGETLGLVHLNRRQFEDIWAQVGRELAKLHRRVSACPDPDGYLDQPGRDLNPDLLLRRLHDAGRVDEETARAIEHLARELEPHVPARADARFIHNDIHPMNIMCSTDGALLAILDWGDAGWGDPALDFATIPLAAIPSALRGYESEAPGALGSFPEARVIRHILLRAVEDLCEAPGKPLPLKAWHRFLQSKRV